MLRLKWQVDPTSRLTNPADGDTGRHWWIMRNRL